MKDMKTDVNVPFVLKWDGKEFDLIANANIPLRGEDFMFFPLEDVHPTYGYTYSGEVVFRF